MLLQQLLQQLRQLKLTGFADSLELQFDQPNTYDDLGFTERLGLLVSQEMTYRENKRLKHLLSAAKFNLMACLDDIDYAHPRGLHKNQVAALQTGEWIAKHHNLVITDSREKLRNRTGHVLIRGSFVLSVFYSTNAPLHKNASEVDVSNIS